jgi:hypothetical protein
MQNYVVGNNREWENACNSHYTPFGILGKSATNVQSIGTGVIAFFFLLGLLIFSKVVRRHRANKAEGRLRLPGDEVSEKSLPDYGAIVRPRDGGYTWDLNNEHALVEHTFTSAPHRSDITPPYFNYL